MPPYPVFKVFFALHGERHGVVFFEIDEAFHFIAPGETLCHTFTMFVNASHNIIGHTDI